MSRKLLVLAACLVSFVALVNEVFRFRPVVSKSSNLSKNNVTMYRDPLMTRYRNVTHENMLATELMPRNQIETGSNVLQRILVSFIPSNPVLEERGAFTYYYDVAHAFTQQKKYVNVCTSDVRTCFQKAKQRNEIYAIIIPHSTISSLKPRRLYRISAGIASRLNDALKESKNSSSIEPCVSVVFWMNKVYQQLPEKVQNLVAPFVGQNLTASINLLAFTWSPHAQEWAQKFGIPFVFVPFGVNTEVFNTSFSPWTSRQCDLFIHWDTSPTKYELRHEISELLASNQSNSTSDIHVYAPTTFLKEPIYLEAIKDCKMHISTIGMPGTVDLIGTRYYEIMASGSSLLLVQRPNSRFSYYSYEVQGMVDGETVVMFSNVTELLEKIRYYKANETAAKAIIDSAKNLSTRLSWGDRAWKIVKGIQEHSRSCQRL